jgi:hypothetical protein
MGIFSTLALILVVLKALGLVTLTWGWCLLGFGVDAVIFVACIVGGYLFSKKVTKGAKKYASGFDLEDQLNKARDRLG